MKFIIRLSPEIVIKSKPVRKRAIKMLNKNIKSHLKDAFKDFNVRYFWDRIDLEIFDNSICESQYIADIIKFIPWISYFSEVTSYDFEKIEDVLENIKKYYLREIENRSFCVRVNRSWKHDFRSIDLERYIWGVLLKESKNSRVNLDYPDVSVKIDIKDNTFSIVKKRYEWIWWYPVWFQDKVLSLISWWFDSGVSTYMTMKRWCKTDFLFFNLWWDAHEIWVKQVAFYLWRKFSKPYNANFITLNFEEIIKDLLEKVDNKYRGVILKRLMLKMASRFEEAWYYALVKWDSLWQVSSQTLKNMFVIDKASSLLTLRPLIWIDKQEIVNISKDIWTYNFACNMPEYCWVISDNPSTWAKLEDIEKQEQNIRASLLDKIYENRKIEKIKEVLSWALNQDYWRTDIVFLAWNGEIVVDLREKEKIKKSPLVLESTEVLEIPFYEINSVFRTLDQKNTYLFYCDKWVLSKLHSLYLKEKWFENIKIFRPNNK